MHDYDVAIAVAEAGAAVVRQCFGTTLQRLEKDAGDFATNADLEAEHAMCAVLQRERPADAILGEENGRGGARSGVRTWLIDPLCGTLNYAVRMRVAAVNVALRVGRRCLAAAVADPFNHEMFWTDGLSAFVRVDGQDTPLAPHGSSKLVDLNCDPPFPNAPAFKAVTLAADAAFVARFRPRVVSTSMALTWVATGQRAAYITDGDVRESVHFAAGLAICEAAGCMVTDLRGRVWGSDATGLVVAADAETHAALVSLVRQYLVWRHTGQGRTRAWSRMPEASAALPLRQQVFWECVQKPEAYCWSCYFHATSMLSLWRILHAPGPATTAYAKLHCRHCGDDQQYPQMGKLARQRRPPSGGQRAFVHFPMVSGWRKLYGLHLSE